MFTKVKGYTISPGSDKSVLDRNEQCMAAMGRFSVIVTCRCGKGLDFGESLYIESVQ